MKITLTVRPFETVVTSTAFAIAAGATAFVLTRLNPLHGAIYGLALGVFASLGLESLEGKEFWKRSVEYISSSAVAYACLKLAGIALAPQTAALLSVAAVVIPLATIIVVDFVGKQLKKPEPKPTF